jgi:collagenase-like PrtC family protease
MTNRVEHAFYISDPADLKYFHNSRFDRIYFGNEFCEFLLPSVEQLANVLEFAARSGVEFTLMTPPCAENCLEKCERLIETLPANAEVVFNDWGLPQAIRDAGKTPVHGRLLCKARKPPKANRFQNILLTIISRANILNCFSLRESEGRSWTMFFRGCASIARQG